MKEDPTSEKPEFYVTGIVFTAGLILLLLAVVVMDKVLGWL